MKKVGVVRVDKLKIEISGRVFGWLNARFTGGLGMRGEEDRKIKTKFTFGEPAIDLMAVK